MDNSIIAALEAALQRIALNISGDPPAQVIAGEALSQLGAKVAKKEDCQCVWIVNDGVGAPVMLLPQEPTPEMLEDTESKIDGKVTVKAFLLLPATFDVSRPTGPLH